MVVVIVECETSIGTVVVVRPTTIAFIPRTIAHFKLKEAWNVEENTKDPDAGHVTSCVTH